MSLGARLEMLEDLEHAFDVSLLLLLLVVDVLGRSKLGRRSFLVGREAEPLELA